MGVTTLDVYRTYAFTKDTLNHEVYLTWVGSLGCIFSSCRFVWSWLIDHFSYRAVYGTLLCMQITLACTFYIAAKSRAMYAIWVWLTLWCEAGHFTLVPNILKKIYGKRATTLYGVAFSFTGLCSLMIVGLLTTHFGHEYIKFWFFTGGMSGISLILLLTLFSEEKFRIRTKAEIFDDQTNRNSNYMS